MRGPLRVTKRFGMIMLCIAQTVASAQNTYYISTSGNDRNAGSKSAPWATFARAKAAISAGDTIYVRGGIYHEFARMNSCDGDADHVTVMRNFPGEMVILDGDTVAAATLKSMGLLDIAYDYWHVSGITVRNSAGNGVRVTGSHSRISGLTIHDIKGGGVVATSGDSIIVEDCTIYNVAMHNLNHALEPSRDVFLKSWGVGIFMTGSGKFPEGDTLMYPIMRRNTVYNSWGEGITFTKCRRGVMEDNVVYNTYSVSLYLLLDEDCMIRRNLVYNTYSMRWFPDEGVYGMPTMGVWNEQWKTFPGFARDTIVNNVIVGGARCIVIAEGQTDMIYANNVFMNSCFLSAVYFDAGTYRNVKFVNNIVVQDSTLPVLLVADSKNADITFGHNLWSKPLSGTGLFGDRKEDVVGDPLFAQSPVRMAAGDVALSDFDLQADSPGINAGVNVGLPYLGDAPDIGAIERRPREFSLQQYRSTPFTRTATIRYELPVASDVKVSVVSAQGAEMSVLVNARKGPGVYDVTVDGSGFPSGIYLCRLTAGSIVITRKLLLLRR